MIRYLRAGKAPKEIAWIMNKTTWAVWKAMERYPDVREAYIDTYHKRYPNREAAPLKVLNLFVQ